MNPILLLLIVGGIYLATKGKGTDEKRAYLKTLSADALWQSVLTKVTDSELADMYTLHTQYKDGVSVPEGPFKQRILAISQKYNIYT